MLNLGKQFRPSTSIVYPPFKKGRYMEEYFYEYFLENRKERKETKETRVYIPIFWTNLQNHPGFSSQKYELLLSNAMSKMPPNTKYFTVVQHDDGPQLKMKGDVLVFGACTGAIPLPLIYEDTDETLRNITANKSNKYLASFIGTKTHPLRQQLYDTLINYQDIYISTQDIWSPKVPQSLANLFIDITLQSKFCLAPRGYGRSSFRFFEAMLMDTIPVYFWDDIEWLPYKDKLDYSTFSVSIRDISKTYEILKSISNEKYISMLEELKKVRHYFTLEGMSEYIMEKILSF